MAEHIVVKDDLGRPTPIGVNEREGLYLCVACGEWMREDKINGECSFKLDTPPTDDVVDYGPVPCPTCNKVGTEPCVRGRYPSPVWDRQEPYPEGHTSRVKVNKK